MRIRPIADDPDVLMRDREKALAYVVALFKDDPGFLDALSPTGGGNEERMVYVAIPGDLMINVIRQVNTCGLKTNLVVPGFEFLNILPIRPGRFTIHQETFSGFPVVDEDDDLDSEVHLVASTCTVGTFLELMKGLSLHTRYRFVKPTPKGAPADWKSEGWF